MDANSSSPPSLALDSAAEVPLAPCCSLGCVGFGGVTRARRFSNRYVRRHRPQGNDREPRSAIPRNRVIETPYGMINAIGLQNPASTTSCAGSPDARLSEQTRSIRET
jgi:hypothetical protein